MPCPCRACGWPRDGGWSGAPWMYAGTHAARDQDSARVQDAKRERGAIVLPVSCARRAWPLPGDAQQVLADVCWLLQTRSDTLPQCVAKGERSALQSLGHAVGDEDPQITGVEVDGERAVAGSRPPAGPGHAPR